MDMCKLSMKICGLECAILALVACSSSPDAQDAGSNDAGIADAGRADAGGEDAGSDAGCGACANGLCLEDGGCAACAPGTCAGELSCCAQRCVDLRRDENDCGACGVSCGASSFCDGTQCVAQQLSNSCQDPSITVILDGLSGDDPVSLLLAAALGSTCSSASVRQVSQLDGGVLDPASGAPLVGASELLAVAGGPFGQQLVAYLEGAGITPVYFQQDATTSSFLLRDGGSVVTVNNSDLAGGARDDFVLEMVKDPASGSLTLVVYGFYSPGTAAGGWYVQNALLPQLPGYAERWYVFGWADNNGNGAPDSLSEFTLIASGP